MRKRDGEGKHMAERQKCRETMTKEREKRKDREGKETGSEEVNEDREKDKGTLCGKRN